jgi:hypothetical protein
VLGGYDWNSAAVGSDDLASAVGGVVSHQDGFELQFV